MLERIGELAARPVAAGRASKDERTEALTPLRAVTAQLLLATAAGATLEQVHHARHRIGPQRGVPEALTWAPLMIGPMAAAATIEHARRPTGRTATALRFLSMASIGVGSSLFLLDAATNGGRPPTRLGPIAFASAGLLGLVLERQEREIGAGERALRARARVVERLVPKRKARVDRIVVHI